MPSHGLNPIENVYVVATAADLPDVLSRFIIYHLLYDPGDGVGLYYSDDESTLSKVSSGAGFVTIDTAQTITGLKTFNVEANSASIVVIGEPSTLRGDSQDGQLTFWGEHSSVIYGSKITQNSSNVSWGGTGANPAISLQLVLNLQILSGNTLQIKDASNADSAEFSHDGEDFNTTFVNTTDWNITVANLKLIGALTATSYGGITEANLLDKSASETITIPNGGSWLFTSDGSGQVFLDLGTDLKLGANDGTTDVFFNHNNSDFRIGVTGTRFNAIPMLFDGINGLRSGQPIYISEQASSNANVTAWGQLWIKSDAPNTLWFTGDTGVERPVGHNVLPYIALTSAYTLLLVDNGERLNRTNTTSFDVTCPDLSTLPVGATYIFTNQGASGTFRVKGATGVTLRHFTGSAVDSVTAGNGFVIATGGIVTVNKVTDTEYHIWGSGITTA